MSGSAEDSSHQLQFGILSAVAHIASVRGAGAECLAAEFSAAVDAIRVGLESPSVPDSLKAMLGSGLSVAIFKSVLQSQLSGDRHVLGLRLADLNGAIDPGDREHYRTLVLAAAEAALRARIDDGPYRRRYVGRWELSALDDIRQVFDDPGDEATAASARDEEPFIGMTLLSELRRRW
jgi:hypothetical protein